MFQSWSEVQLLLGLMLILGAATLSTLTGKS
jgi:hypothetical protein